MTRQLNNDCKHALQINICIDAASGFILVHNHLFDGGRSCDYAGVRQEATKYLSRCNSVVSVAALNACVHGCC